MTVAYQLAFKFSDPFKLAVFKIQIGFKRKCACRRIAYKFKFAGVGYRNSSHFLWKANVGIDKSHNCSRNNHYRYDLRKLNKYSVAQRDRIFGFDRNGLCRYLCNDHLQYQNA